MRRSLYGILAVALVFSLSVMGCKKKEEPKDTLSGFEALESSELSSIPMTSTTTEPTMEALPVEPSPVTPPAAMDSVTQAATTAAQSVGDVASLSKDKQIQTALKAAGFYNGAIDGKLGPASKKAIMAFQSANGLTADGKVGPKTWAAMEKYLTGAASAITSAVAQ